MQTVSAQPAVRQFQLFVEIPAREGSPHSLEAMPRLEVSAGVSSLTVAAEGRPAIAPATGLVSSGGWLLEPVMSGDRQPRLLLVSPQLPGPSVNGQPAPRAVLLDVADQVQLTPDCVVHVTVHRKPWIGTPPEELIGNECPICRRVLTAESLVYVCPSCQRMALHFDSDEGLGEPLECVRLSSECLACEAPVELTEGYAWLPELT